MRFQYSLYVVSIQEYVVNLIELLATISERHANEECFAKARQCPEIPKYESKKKKKPAHDHIQARVRLQRKTFIYYIL